jgi:predicted metal-binding membrane protein
MSDTALEAVLLRDRAVVIVALAIITALAWADLAWLSDDMAMGSMDMTGYRMIPAGRGLMMPADAPWQPIEFGYVFVMWVVMMIGMMMPSAAPMILIYARVGRQAAVQGKRFASSSWFPAAIFWPGRPSPWSPPRRSGRSSAQRCSRQ